MIPDEPELRRALDARSGPLPPDLASRIGSVVAAPRSTTTWLPAIAAVTVIAISIASVAALIASRNFNHSTHSGLSSGARAASPSPSGKGRGEVIYLPTSAQLSAPSGDVVWAYVANKVLFYSLDSGDNFQQRSLPMRGDMGPDAISFADASNGWALYGGPGATQCSFGSAQIWRTTDGAVTWRLVSSVDPDHSSPTGIGFEQCKENISFVDKEHGFVTAGDENHPPSIYRTSDGGLTWHRSTLPDPPGFKTLAGGDALRAGRVYRFGATLLVSADGMQPSGAHRFVFQSIDGGASWRAIAEVKPVDGSLAFVSGTRWLRVVLPGQSMETLDAGRSWHAYGADYTQAAGVAPEVVFGDAQVGYAEVRGSIQRTTDAGLHWSTIKTPGVFWPG